MIQTQRVAWRRSRLDWDTLIARLQPVPAAGITRIALEYLQPAHSQTATEPEEIWRTIGGAEGLARMRNNAEVLLALASFAQHWNHPESIIVAERMRRDGLALRRAAWRITLTAQFGIGRLSGPFYLHEAASAYYLMRQRLLVLYQTSHTSRYPQLAAAV